MTPVAFNVSVPLETVPALSSAEKALYCGDVSAADA